ncbi:hypothetical protein G0Q06_09120 [Puniceicoccales bacterium CK1056]|uniref:Uncharacterized protein n=1 Tax=Oceanipulchritudo coccoides TaxID=2706888 RepID=A0A6B2M4P8_9BACT|nr:hypothetical protein [Oceanipulchritudo coccoides]NDV62610.1 hypothetical protein [Oceanipulchritudo coccoides]
MKYTQLRNLTLALAFLLAGVLANAASDKASTRVDDVIWANGDIYSTVLTTNSFKNPPAHTLDLLFNFDMSGLSGQRPVADAAPGVGHYNGGRWSVQLVAFTDAGKAAHDPDGDGVVNFELTSADMVLHHVELGHIVITPVNFYFSCPLVKSGR